MHVPCTCRAHAMHMDMVCAVCTCCAHAAGPRLYAYHAHTKCTPCPCPCAMCMPCVCHAYACRRSSASTSHPNPNPNPNPSPNPNQVLGLDFSPDGKMLASGSDDHSARLWDLRKKKCAPRHPSPPPPAHATLHAPPTLPHALTRPRTPLTHLSPHPPSRAGARTPSRATPRSSHTSSSSPSTGTT